MALNRSKPYGEVNGPGYKYKYEQNNKIYNQDGYEVDESGKLLEKPGPEAGAEIPPKQVKTESASVAELDTEETPSPKGNPVPEIGLDQASESDVELTDEELEALTVPELKDQLSRLGIDFGKKPSKPELQAMLREELAAREVEAKQEDS